jgi:hypothetical protein
MRRSLRHSLVATLIALHAAVTLLGPSLHALPGWGHGSGLSPLAKTDHSHGSGKSSHAKADDCPVCQFLTQGQLSTDLAASATGWLVAALDLPIPPPADQASPHGLSSPRAPPII